MVPFEGCCEGLLSKDHAVAALRLVEDDDPGDRATPLSGTQLDQDHRDVLARLAGVTHTGVKEVQTLKHGRKLEVNLKTPTE